LWEIRSQILDTPSGTWYNKKNREIVRKLRMVSREELLEVIQRLRLIDDDFFTVCFDKNIECTELLLHIILGRTDLKVERVDTQVNLPNLRGRSVRLDAYARDTQGRRYNIEIQRDDRGADPRRARYNSSLMDADASLPGEAYSDLPDVYVIFITEHDFYHLGLPLYEFERTCSNAGLNFNDGSHIIYVNGSYRGDSPLGKLMADFHARQPEEMNYPALQKRLNYFKNVPEGVEHMCVEVERLVERLVESQSNIARAEGISEGERKNAIENAAKMLTKNLPIELISECTGLTVEEVTALAEK
jgi:hypothetical protein